ncbi:MAG: histidinol-phosphate transaminase [Gammaproteobacteria bacterium]|nr:histidinol-phosphate transaminase [Gammaproteobacteria bacterium]
MARQRAFDDLAVRGVRGLHPYIPGKPNDELERESGIADSIKLASNENPLGPPAAALEAIRGELEGVALYPDGSGFHLKRSLASKLGVEPDSITLGNGSNEILVLLAETFLDRDVEAIYDQYSFAIYRLAVQATGAIARVAASHAPDRFQSRGHDLSAFRALLTESSRVVFIANPNNPTGTWVAHDELHAFMRDVPRETLVVVDEAYGEYVTRDDYPDTIPWLAEFPNLVILRTFSKIYGLAGLRVGYSISSPQVAELLNRVRPPFNVNSLALAAARAALEEAAFVGEARRINAAGLEYLTSSLTALGYRVTPSIGNFVLVDIGRPAGEAYDALLRAGIIVRPVANYGLPDHLRITVGLSEQNRRLIEAMQDIGNE